MIRLTLLLIAGILICFQVKAQTSDCNLAEYKTLMREANKLASNGLYDQAIDKLQSAKICQPLRETEVNNEIKRVFEKVNGERVRAEEQTRRNYADDLASKSRSALDGRDISSAFRLSDFAFNYVDDNNYEVLQSLVNAYYFNENPNNKNKMWNKAFQLELPDAHKTFDMHGHLLAITSSVARINYRYVEVSILDLRTRKYLITFPVEKGYVLSTCFSRDGQLVCLGYYDGFALAYDIKTGQLRQKFLVGAGVSISDLAFSPNGEEITIVGADSLVRTWNVALGNLVAEFKGHEKMVLTICYAPDGKIMATSSVDNTIKIWDCTTKQCIKTFRKDNYSSCIAFSQNSNELIAGYLDHTVRVWNIQDQSDRILYEHKAPVSSLYISQDGRYIASSSEDKTTRFFDLFENKEATTFASPTYNVQMIGILFDRFEPVTYSNDHQLRIWYNLNNNNIAPGKHLNEQNLLDFSKNGQYFISCSNDKTVNLWNIKTGELEHQYHHDYTVNCLAISADMKQLAVGLRNYKVQIWDIASETVIKELTGHQGFVTTVAYSPDGNLLASGSSDSTVIIWDNKQFDLKHKLERKFNHVVNVTFSPDSRRLGVCYRTAIATIWQFKVDVKTDLIGHRNTIWDLAFSPEGKKVATCSSDQTVKIWEVESGLVYATIPVPTADVRCLAFSSDSRLIATGSMEFGMDPLGYVHASGQVSSLVNILDVELGRPVLNFTGEKKLIENITFSKDNSRIYATFSDSTLHAWDITCEAILKNWQTQNGVSTMPTAQLIEYNLEELLDQKPENESKLLQTNEYGQIAAFADMFAEKARGSEVLKQVQAFHGRADRLYSKALQLTDDPLIKINYFKMLVDQFVLHKLNKFQTKVNPPEKKLLALIQDFDSSSLVKTCIYYLGEKIGALKEFKDIIDGLSLAIAISEYNYKLEHSQENQRILILSYVNTALYQIQNHAPEKAELLIRKSMEVQPGNPYANDYLAITLLLQGKKENAFTEFDKWKNKPHPAWVGHTYRERHLDFINTLKSSGIAIPFEAETIVFLKN